MITALWVVGYVLGALAVGRAVHVISADSRDPDKPLGLALMMLVWPAVVAIAAVVVPVGAAVWLVTRPTRAERHAARLRSAQKEREYIRAEARRLGLPMLDDTTTKEGT